MAVIMIFVKQHEYFIEINNMIHHCEGTIASDSVDNNSRKALLNAIDEKPAGVSWHSIFMYAMNGNPSQYRGVFISRANKYIKMKQREKELSKIRTKKPESKDVLAAWRNCSLNLSNANQVDDLLKLFNGNIIKIKLPLNKTLNGQNFNVEASLISGDYDTIHKWIIDNIKSINGYVKKLLIDKYGNSLNAYHAFEITHLRSGILFYQFELKPELVNAIEEAVNK